MFLYKIKINAFLLEMLCVIVLVAQNGEFCVGRLHERKIRSGGLCVIFPPQIVAQRSCVVIFKFFRF